MAPLDTWEIKMASCVSKEEEEETEEKEEQAVEGKELEEDMARYSLKGQIDAGLIDTLLPTRPHSTRIPPHANTSTGQNAATIR